MDNLIVYLTRFLGFIETTCECLVSFIPPDVKIRLLWKTLSPGLSKILTQQGFICKKGEGAEENTDRYFFAQSSILEEKEFLVIFGSSEIQFRSRVPVQSFRISFQQGEVDYEVYDLQEDKVFHFHRDRWLHTFFKTVALFWVLYPVAELLATKGFYNPQYCLWDKLSKDKFVRTDFVLEHPNQTEGSFWREYLLRVRFNGEMFEFEHPHNYRIMHSGDSENFLASASRQDWLSALESSLEFYDS